MIIFSTKNSQLSGSDVSGGSLPHILFSHFWKDCLGGKVLLHDPFYHTSSKLLHRLDGITEHLPIIDHNHRIVSPFFYKGKVKFGKFTFNMEKFKSASLKIKKSKLLFDAPWAPIESQLDASNFPLYAFDIPFIYYFDLLARQKYQPNLQLKNSNKLSDSLIKHKNIYGLQVRLNHWKQLQNTLSYKEYKQLLISIVNKISGEDKRHLILLYGDINSDPALREEIQSSCQFIDINSEFESILERAWALSNVNVSIGTASGFTMFANYLSLASNKLKGYYIINDVAVINDILHINRILRNGIVENNIAKNSFFFSLLKFFPRNSIESENFTLTNTEDANYENPNEVERLKIIFYDPKFLSHLFFDENIDRYFINLLAHRYQEWHPGIDVLICDNEQYLQVLSNDEKIKINKSYMLQCQHMLTHYSIHKYKAENTSTKMKSDTLDFVHPFSKGLSCIRNELNTSNYFYEKLPYFIFRESKQHNNVLWTEGSKRLLIVGENSKFVKNKKMDEYIEKFSDLFITKNLLKLFLFSFSYIYRFFGRFIKNILLKHTPTIKNQKSNKSTLILNELSDHLIYDGKKLLLRGKNTHEEIQFSYQALQNLLKSYNKVICIPCPISLAIRVVDKENKSVLFSNSGFGLSITDKPKLFNKDIDLKYEDFWDLHFVGLDELLLHLGIGKHILSPEVVHQ